MWRLVKFVLVNLILGVLFSITAMWDWLVEIFWYPGIYLYGLIVNLSVAVALAFAFQKGSDLEDILKARRPSNIIIFLFGTGLILFMVFMLYAMSAVSYFYGPQEHPRWSYMLVGTMPHMFLSSVLAYIIFKRSNAMSKAAK